MEYTSHVNARIQLLNILICNVHFVA